MSNSRFGIRSALTFALMSVIPVLINAQAGTPSTDRGASVQSDSQIHSDLAKVFSKDRFKNVQSTVNDGIVTLTGNVALFAEKEEADNKAHHINTVIAVRNQIHAGGTQVSDQELQQKLLKKLEYGRVGYGTTAFNAISVSVSNGVVTLGWHAYGPTGKDSALSVASYTLEFGM
jgi:hyperosmotically inducible protein